MGPGQEHAEPASRRLQNLEPGLDLRHGRPVGLQRLGDEGAGFGAPVGGEGLGLVLGGGNAQVEDCGDGFDLSIIVNGCCFQRIGGGRIDMGELPQVGGRGLSTRFQGFCVEERGVQIYVRFERFLPELVGGESIGVFRGMHEGGLDDLGGCRSECRSRRRRHCGVR